MSEAEWLEEAAREKLAADTERASLADRTAYDAVLARVPDAPPVPGDER